MTTPKELRTLVAERVMGWDKREMILWGDEPETVFCIPDSHAESEDGIGIEAVVALEDWNPFESWASAGRVLRKIREWPIQRLDRFCLILQGIVQDRKVETLYSWPAFIEPGDISLAALRALGVEVE